MLKICRRQSIGAGDRIPAVTILSAKANRRTPPTPAVFQARRLGARVRVALAVVGGLLVIVDPGRHPHPLLAVLGWAVIAVTGQLLTVPRSDRWLWMEESVGASAGVLIVTLGPERMTGLTMLWLAAVAAGVVARGGRVGTPGRVIVVAVLLSPLVRFGVTADGLSLFAAGAGLLLVTGRISREISELLRDHLTGAVSRAVLEGQIARFLAVATAERPASLIMIDLDDFGAVNKSQGYAAGDLLLVRAVESITASLSADDVLGRLGGDEFAVIGFRSDPGKLARQIVENLAEAGIGASVGIALAPLDAEHPRALKLAADFALRLSKQTGKGRATGYNDPTQPRVVVTAA